MLILNVAIAALTLQAQRLEAPTRLRENTILLLERSVECGGMDADGLSWLVMMTANMSEAELQIEGDWIRAFQQTHSGCSINDQTREEAV